MYGFIRPTGRMIGIDCVDQEFATLAEDANIYKLVGPVLLKQETSEAKSTVEGRLDFIDKEMSVSILREYCRGVPLTLI